MSYIKNIDYNRIEYENGSLYFGYMGLYTIGEVSSSIVSTFKAMNPRQKVYFLDISPDSKFHSNFSDYIYSRNVLYVIHVSNGNAKLTEIKRFETDIVGMMQNMILCIDGTIYRIIEQNTVEYIKTIYKYSSHDKFKVHEDGISCRNSFWVMTTVLKETFTEETHSEEMMRYDIPGDTVEIIQISCSDTGWYYILCDNSKCYKFSPNMDCICYLGSNIETIINHKDNTMLVSYDKTKCDIEAYHVRNVVRDLSKYIKRHKLFILSSLVCSIDSCGNVCLIKHLFSCESEKITVTQTGFICDKKFKSSDWMESLIYKKIIPDIEFQYV